MDNVRIGEDVNVISGPHEGRCGTVAQVREVTAGNNTEPYALVNISERNVFNEVNNDQISVPVRRLAPRR